MGTVRCITPAAGDVTFGQAADAYLATLRGAEHANTRRVYGRILARVAIEFGSGTVLDEISAERFAEWFGQQWGQRTPSTWNVSLDAVRSAVAYKPMPRRWPAIAVRHLGLLSSAEFAMLDALRLEHRGNLD